MRAPLADAALDTERDVAASEDAENVRGAGSDAVRRPSAGCRRIGLVPHRSPVRVVLVDDHEPLRTLLKDALTQRGCEVVAEAGNGREALDAVRVGADVVVMDYSMPVMNGLAATAAIHQQFPDVEIVAFTSLYDAAVIDAMLEAGASGHFAKPHAKALVDYIAGR
jgi:CheY-like chemotaxis protein